MRIPESLAPLFEYGILDDVVRPLMSGKEAQVYLVVSGGNLCVAKVYKEAMNRTFKNRAEYTEGRKTRNSRDQRAIDKRSKHGRAQDEAAWRSTEVDMIHRLHAGGVRVPVPYHFVDGVLIMELITDAEGNPAPRLGDLQLEPEAATEIYHQLMREVVRMLCAGVVHGDLSDFNVLVGANGPVIIDFPQSVDSAKNTNARKLLIRDVDNLHRFLATAAPRSRILPYAQEMWDLYQQNVLTPDTRLGGRYRAAERRVDTQDVLGLIQEANLDEQKRRETMGGQSRGAPYRGGPNRGGPNRGGPNLDGPSLGGPTPQQVPSPGGPHRAAPTSNATTSGEPNRGGPHSSSSHREHSNREASNRDNPNRDSSNRDNPNRGVPDRDAPNREASNRDNSSRDNSNRDAANRDAANRGSSNRDAANRDAANRGSSNRDAANRGSSNRDAANRGSSNRDNPRQSQSRQSQSRQSQSRQSQS